MNIGGTDSSFLDHLEALRRALWRSVAAIAVFLIPGVFAAMPALEWLVRYSCPAEIKLNYFTPMEPLLVQLKLGLILAVIAAMPVILYQLAGFVAPGLYEHERRACRWVIWAALGLFLAGASLGLFLVTPLMMRFSAQFASEALSPVIGIGGFVNLVGLLTLSFGIMFQLPVVMVFLVRFGVVELATLRRSRPIAVTIIFILAAILTPPDIVSQLLLGVPTWLLFEIALLIAGRGEKRKSSGKRSEEGAEEEEACPETSDEEEMHEPEPYAGRPEENTMDAVYRDSYRKKRRKNRHFGVISGHYRGKRGAKK